MSGVFFQLSSENLTFVATDAHKLVKHTRTDLSANKTAAFILPKKPLNILKNNIAENVKLEFNDTNALFTFDNNTIICRLIDGKYPNYCLLYTSPSPRDRTRSRMPSSA